MVIQLSPGNNHPFCSSTPQSHEQGKVQVSILHCSMMSFCHSTSICVDTMHVHFGVAQKWIGQTLAQSDLSLLQINSNTLTYSCLTDTKLHVQVVYYFMAMFCLHRHPSSLALGNLILKDLAIRLRQNYRRAEN